MSAAPWSISRALTQLAEGDCPELVCLDDLVKLRSATAAKGGSEVGYGDALLLHVINNELVSSIVTATYVHEHDDKHREEETRFKEAYAAFSAEIERLSEPLRSSVSLPPSYIRSLDTNPLLRYAVPRPNGRPTEVRRDEFFTNLLVLYRMTAGKKPGGGETGPTVRFFRAIETHLARCLEAATDRGSETYKAVAELWRLPVNRGFLKDWMSNKGGYEALEKYVNQMVELHVAAYSRARLQTLAEPIRRGSISLFPNVGPERA